MKLCKHGHVTGNRRCRCGSRDTRQIAGEPAPVKLDRRLKKALRHTDPRCNCYGCRQLVPRRLILGRQFESDFPALF